MSYHIYTTTGIVLSERPLREADRVYTIFTRDLGLIRASATATRKDLSKLRGHIEPFSISSVSLVRGREYWRLTSAEIVTNLQNILKNNPELFLVLAKNFALLEKLVAGEEKHPELFNSILTVIRFIEKDGFTTKDFESIEILLAARILHNLGYLSEEQVPKSLFSEEPSRKMLENVIHKKKSLIQAINHGIQSSQLAS